MEEYERVMCIIESHVWYASQNTHFIVGKTSKIVCKTPHFPACECIHVRVRKFLFVFLVCKTSEGLYVDSSHFLPRYVSSIIVLIVYLVY